jgi:hypothetical protein
MVENSKTRLGQAEQEYMKEFRAENKHKKFNFCSLFNASTMKIF